MPSFLFFFFFLSFINVSVLHPPYQMISNRHMNSEWLQSSLNSWLQRCQNADSAESIEMLKEVCVTTSLNIDVLVWFCSANTRELACIVLK